jgi:hypothetical protein
MYIQAGTADLTKAAGETLIKKQTRDSWNRNSAKDAVGQPSLYFLNKEKSPLEMWLWPIPEEAGTVRYQKHILIADTMDGSATLDLRQYWHLYVMYKLAEMLAEAGSLPRQRVSALRKYAKEYMRTARARAHQGVSLQQVVSHSGSRRRYR